jgi:hypothetical protein
VHSIFSTLHGRNRPQLDGIREDLPLVISELFGFRSGLWGWLYLANLVSFVVGDLPFQCLLLRKSASVAGFSSDTHDFLNGVFSQLYPAST